MNNLIKAAENGNKNFKIESDFLTKSFSGTYGEMIDRLLQLKKEAMIAGWSTSQIENDSFNIIKRSGHDSGIKGYVKIIN